MMDPADPIEAAVAQALSGRGVTGHGVAVAVSGGVDSVVTAHAALRTGTVPLLIHVHHGLRGEDADADAAFVEELAARWSCPVAVCDIGNDLESQAAGASMQERARSLRYEAMERICRDHGVAFLVTGHTMDDQAETVLLQLVRGTGPDGLSGMRPERPLSPDSPVLLIRPLLGVTRNEVVAHAERHRLTWREDASNRSEAYLRNAVRARVIPVLEELTGGGAVSKLARAAAWIRAYRETELEPLTRVLIDAGTRTLPGDGLLLRAAVVAPLPDVWRGRIVLRALERALPDAPRTESTVTRVLDLLSSQVGRSVPVAGGAVWRERDGLAFAPDRPVPGPATLVPDTDVAWNGSVYRLETDRTESVDGAVHLAPSAIRAPLVVRAWRPGDRIHPVGMEGSRKVKEMLTDARVPAFARSRAAVVASDRDVVWLVGIRADRRFLASGDGPFFALSVRPPS